MNTEIVYMPTFRSRQEENKVLREFDFGDNMYPMVEIIKEHDRARKNENQKSFDEIYVALLDEISAKKVFVDIPIGSMQSKSVKKEVLSFRGAVANNVDVRTEYLISLSDLSDKIIPVVFSYRKVTGSTDSIQGQVYELRQVYDSICFRVQCDDFNYDWPIVSDLSTDSDFVVLDLDAIPPYPTPAMRSIIADFELHDRCEKIVLRSAIDKNIKNNQLQHDRVVMEADNSLLKSFRNIFNADAFGDYVGIKKDDLTSGGTISPGFIFYNPIDNQYYGYRGVVKDISSFENVIVPDVINSRIVNQIIEENQDFLSTENKGWKSLLNIFDGNESGRNQAKFKKISMSHYLHCIKIMNATGKIG